MTYRTGKCDQELEYEEWSPANQFLLVSSEAIFEVLLLDIMPQYNWWTVKYSVSYKDKNGLRERFDKEYVKRIIGYLNVF